MTNILVAYDGSESAKRALEQAAELVDGGELSVISVAEILPPVGRVPGMVIPEFEAERKQNLSDALGILEQRGVKAQAVQRRGDPAAMILDEAEKEDIGLIVIGTRGLNGAKRLLLGSVSTHVMHHAPCNVLVVR
jgi:nucleotide-binding universal stress UspA family protein